MSTELDIEIAEKVLGWKRIEGPEAIIAGGYTPAPRKPEDEERFHYKRIWADASGEKCACEECGSMPDFSTNLESAWVVFEHMRTLGFSSLVNALAIGEFPPLNDNWPRDSPYHCSVVRDYRFHGFGKTPAEAICRAALKAVESHDKPVSPEGACA